MAATLQTLQAEYQEASHRAERLGTALQQQLHELLMSEDLRLGAAIEYRTKKWASLSEKLERKGILLDSVLELPDLVGLRVMLLFNRDLDKACELIERNFTVLEKEDTKARLGDSQFGYRSLHYILKLPDGWLTVPSFVGLGDLRAEIQVRTMAQHIWAAASHALQYKREEDVPLPIRRSIYRVSALLETVDLEFERLLDERSSYIQTIDLQAPSEELNVDIVKALLDERLPPQNKNEPETYADLMQDLVDFGISDSAKLKQLVEKWLDAALEKDREEVEQRNGDPTLPRVPERQEKGVFYFHVGLVRTMLKAEFGDKYRDYQLAKREAKPAVQPPPPRRPRRRRKS